MIYFSHFPAPTTALRFSCKYPTPASDPAHPAFAIPSPEHLPRCSYPEHHGLRLPLPLQYSFFRWSPHHRSSRSNRSNFRFRCGSALHTQGHGNSGYCCGRRSSGRNGWNHFFQQTLLSFFHPQRCAVEFISGFHPKRMVFFQIFAVGIVESAGFHSFPVIHVRFSFFGIAYLILLSPEMSAHFLL